MSGLEGRTIGAYRLLEQIGKGGMGVVYRAQHLRLGSEAAVKVLPAAMAGDDDFLRRFHHEAVSAASLQHPNILSVWDYGEQDGIPYLVMPFIRAGTLKDRLRRGPLPPGECVSYLRQLAAAVDHAHERGIIHRDIKPANILVDERGHLYLSDLGIAKALEGGPALTRAGVSVGTPQYMAPEQFQGRTERRSDLYSVGVVLYQMLTGQVPYSGSTPYDVLTRQLQAPPPPIRQLNPGVPPSVEQVLLRALVPDPTQRYQNAAELAAAFEAALAAPVTPPPQPQPWPAQGLAAPGGPTYPGYPTYPAQPAHPGPSPTPQPAQPPPPAPAATRPNRLPLILGGAGAVALLLVACLALGLVLRSRSSAAAALAGPGRSRCSRAMARARSEKPASPRSRRSASRMPAGEDSRLGTDRPAPAHATRAAFSAMSPPAGEQMTGTPALRACATVPCPPWLMAAAHSGMVRAYEGQSTIRALDGTRTSGASGRPFVAARTRTGSAASPASDARKSRCSGSCDVLGATSTSGSSPGGAERASSSAGRSQMSGPVTRAQGSSARHASSSGKVATSESRRERPPCSADTGRRPTRSRAPLSWSRPRRSPLRTSGSKARHMTRPAAVRGGRAPVE
jgi:hypothetical protein